MSEWGTERGSPRNKILFLYLSLAHRKNKFYRFSLLVLPNRRCFSHRQPPKTRRTFFWHQCGLMNAAIIYQSLMSHDSFRPQGKINIPRPSCCFAMSGWNKLTDSFLRSRPSAPPHFPSISFLAKQTSQRFNFRSPTLVRFFSDSPSEKKWIFFFLTVGFPTVFAYQQQRRRVQLCFAHFSYCA